MEYAKNAEYQIHDFDRSVAGKAIGHGEEGRRFLLAAVSRNDVIARKFLNVKGADNSVLQLQPINNELRLVEVNSYRIKIYYSMLTVRAWNQSWD